MSPRTRLDLFNLLALGGRLRGLPQSPAVRDDAGGDGEAAYNPMLAQPSRW